MSLVEVLPNVQSLGQDESHLMEAGQSYPVWSPDNAYAAAATMLEVLESQRGES